MNDRVLAPMMQMAYVVTDLHDAVRQWTSKLGVGPFCVFERATYVENETDGVRSNPEFGLAFAYTGDLQIELVQLLNDEPSAFSVYAPSPLNGFHHIGRLTHDMAADEARLKAAGMRPVGYQLSETGVRVAFFHGGPQAGGLVELIRADDRIVGFFGLLKQAAAQWDGKTPYWKLPG